MQVLKKLSHDGKDSEVKSIAWHPYQPNNLCSVGTDQKALIWEINSYEETADR